MSSPLRRTTSSSTAYCGDCYDTRHGAECERIVNWHLTSAYLALQQLHSCTSFSFFLGRCFLILMQSSIYCYTMFFIALSLTVLSLVRRFGQKRLLND